MRSARAIGVLGLAAMMSCASSGTAPEEKETEAGTLGLSPDLTDYVKRAGELLAKEPAGRGFPASSAVWPMSEISVGWENPTPADAVQRGWVKDAVEKSWCAHSSIKLTGWGKADASTNIRILIDDENPHTKGLGRHLDKRKDGMVLNFTFKKWAWSNRPFSPYPGMSPTEFGIRCNAIHEFGHALGLAHEHNRADTPEEAKKCFKSQGTDGDLTLGPYDKDSCMNYANKKWSNFGQLSEGDKKSIEFLYPKSGRLPPIGKTWQGKALAPMTRAKPGFVLDLKLTQNKTELSGSATLLYVGSKSGAGASDPLLASRVTYKVLGWQVNSVALLYPAAGPRTFELEKIVLGAPAPELHKIEFDGLKTWSVDGKVVPAKEIDALINAKGLRFYMPDPLLVSVENNGSLLRTEFREGQASYVMGLRATE